MALVQTCEVDENEASYFSTTVDDETITKSLYNANGKCGNVGVSSTRNQVTKCDFSTKGQPVPISFSVGQAKKTVVADIDVMCFTDNRYGVVVAMNNPSSEDEEPVEEQEGDGFMTKKEKMDDSAWMYDENQDHSDLSGMLGTKGDSSSEDEDINDGRSMPRSGSTATGTSGSSAGLVDNKENRTPLVGSTPASRLPSSTQMHRKREDRTVNVSAIIDKNKELKEEVYDLKLKLSAINRELPWIMIDGTDHLAQYIQFKNDNESLRNRLEEQEKNLKMIKGDHVQLVKQERERLQEEHIDEVSQLKMQYERVCQECDALREEVGRANPSPRDFDRSMTSDVSSVMSEKTRTYEMMVLKVEALEKDVKAAKIAGEAERRAAITAQNELEELRRTMEEKENEWRRRESIATLQETFHIGIEGGGSRRELIAKIDEQLGRIDILEEEVKNRVDTEKKMASLVRNLMREKKEMENELRQTRDASISIMDNKEVDEIMRELLELSEMNSQLQEECRRRGAMRERKKEGGKDGKEMEEIKKELETTIDICEQYQKMGDRLAPLQQRVVAMNKSVMERRSFLEGLKGFEVSGLTPIRLGDGSPVRSGTPGTPAGRGGHTRLLHSVLQRSVLNVSYADMLNCSINTSQGIKIAKGKLTAMKESCRRLFEKLQSSYALFDEIRLALGGDENLELARLMADLRIDLEMSVVESGEATKAIEVVENSLFELQSMLEISMGGGEGRESDFNLSTALARNEEEKGEGGVRRKELIYSIDMTASGERQDTAEMREKLSTLSEDYRLLQMESEELKEKNAEADRQRDEQEEKYGKLQKEREELYREVESRREREERLIEENERLLRQVEEAVEEVKRRKAEIEETVANMQDHIERQDEEAMESNRLRDLEERKREEDMKEMKRSIDEKEVEIESLHGRLEEISKELQNIRDEEKKSGVKMSRLERETESYKEQLERTSEQYARLNEEFEDEKKIKEELEKKLQKYKFKAIEEAEMNRKANERDEFSTQTSLTMEKLSRMEWSEKEMKEDLSRLGRRIEEAFLKKGEYDNNPQRCIDEMDVHRLVDIVTRTKQKMEENNLIMEKTNKELQRHIENEEEMRNASRDPSPDEKGDGQGDSYTTVGGVTYKFEDPIRQLFYALTHVTNLIVQRYKKAQTKMMSGGLGQTEYNTILEMLRDVRKELNERFGQIRQRCESDPDAGDARMTLRLALVMEANEKLKSRINQLVTALRSNWNAEEKAKLLEKVVVEMAEISKTLTTTVGVKQGRLPSSSSAATASTRKI